jgi:hypothetical protein
MSVPLTLLGLLERRPSHGYDRKRLDARGVDAINVQTDGSTPAVEQARTLLETPPAYAGGVIVSLGIIAATFPLLARITGPEVARNE